MTNDECGMTKEAPITNDQNQAMKAMAQLCFELRHFFVIRHSSFVIHRAHSFLTPTTSPR
jgi:hypothetical protein